jgi:tetratricopeptide (TPR) repeat protein
MLIFRGTGLEPLEKVIRSSLKYYSDTFNFDSIRQNLQSVINQSPTIKLPDLDSIRRPLEELSKGLSNAVSQFVSRPRETIDYKAVVSTFLPPGASLIRPQYPENSNEIQFADLDGDGRRELVTSYTTNEGIKTLVLKKDAVQWYKIAELSTPDFKLMHYRNSAIVSSDGKPFLLLGMESAANKRTLIAYSLEGGSARKIFSKDYSKIDLQTSRSSTSAPGRAVLALWHEEAPDVYDIELINWNGFELTQLNGNRYLSNKVIPYYIRKLRINPDDAASWYNLANCMAKAGNPAHALRAVDLGLARSQDTMLNERFNTLRGQLL